MSAGKADSGVGRPRLKDHRLPLGRPLDVERPLDLEEASLVTKRMQLVAVEKFAADAVAEEGVVIPTVPQTLDHFQIFVGDLVAKRVFGVVAAVILRRSFERRCHRVPAGAPAADEIERGKLPGNGEGIAVGRGNRARQADLARHRCKRG
ncbi:hypothetical protein D3C80_1447770 [compost metagenome]